MMTSEDIARVLVWAFLQKENLVTEELLLRPIEGDLYKKAGSLNRHSVIICYQFPRSRILSLHSVFHMSQIDPVYLTKSFF
ncbi:MAG: hypothetical protein MZV64_48875 [Ignavibacteriales bacterium]|nr:hypothetical protein [Ignavibacteriales bacterium]